MKVLYICPFANHAGHPPTAAVTETKALTEQGVDVTLLTFDGLMHGADSSVPEIQVMPRKDGLVNMRKHLLSQWVLRFIETSSVFRKAAGQKGYDIIHVRDGDPFVWMPMLFSRRNQNWVVSLMGASLFTTGNTNGIARKMFDCVANGRYWRSVVKQGLKYSKFQFITQDVRVSQAYEKWIDGVLTPYISTVERGAPPVQKPMDKVQARNRLGIKLDKTVFLSFGAPHGGKDIETVFKSMIGSDATLIVAGSSEYSIGVKPNILAQKYNLNGNVMIFDQYIPESDKALYFGASDMSILSYTKGFQGTSSMLWESCRFGVPVIASDANHLSRDVIDNRLGVTFAAEDADSLREAMRYCMSMDYMSSGKFRQNCIQYAEDNSLAVWAKKCIKIYEGMLNV